MPRTRTFNSFFSVMTIITAAVLLFTGCSESPISPEPTNDGPVLMQRSVKYTSSISLSPLDLYTEQTVSAAEGGRLVLEDVVLDIPAGAVDNDTLFSILIPDIEVFFNEFGTDGLVFNKPVTVTMSYRNADLSGVDESTIRIGWLNEVTGQWEAMVCELDKVNQTVTGKLYHFSAYGLISD